MKSLGKSALGVATLGMLVFSFCPHARAQAAPTGGGYPHFAQMGLQSINMYRCRRSSRRE